jgi:hypothetical protein
VLRLPEDLQAEVVFVIADGHRVLMKSVMASIIGSSVVLFDPVVNVLQRRALNRISGVDRQKTGILFASLFDQRSDFAQSTIVRAVSVVIEEGDFHAESVVERIVI